MVIGLYKRRPRPSLQNVWKLETSRHIAHFPTCLPFPSPVIKSKLSKRGLYQASHHCSDPTVICRSPLLATMFTQRISCILEFVYHLVFRRAHGVSEAGSSSVLSSKTEKYLLSWAESIFESLVHCVLYGTVVDGNKSNSQ
jgi:hypothetical protein